MEAAVALITAFIQGESRATEVAEHVQLLHTLDILTAFQLGAPGVGLYSAIGVAFSRSTDEHLVGVPSLIGANASQLLPAKL